ncbi:MAG: sigma-70 family RNA polymerase sigma factor [Anaerolineae bacterium]|nr:sigma-70 family RNA polymerase sigma factor [Anaerolineae bacterium]
MPAPASDEQLMLEVGRGSAEAFEALYERYRRPLYGFILRCVHDRTVAEDLYQDTFLRLLRAAPRWRPQARLSTWLYRVALNVCLDAQRKHRAGRMDPAAVEAVADPRPGPHECAQSAELLQDLGQAMARLPLEQRAVLLLRYCEGLAEREVAEIMGCPPGTVKSRLHHALRRLREQLQAAEMRPGTAGEGRSERD